jgi:hypothetical protein
VLGRVPFVWGPRDEPLAPIAVAARGSAARALAARLARRDDASLGRLTGVAGPSLLIALGEADALPWVDGVVYLGRDPGAPSLLLPTTLAPDAPIALIERAILGRAESRSAPFAVLVDPPALVGVGAARPISRERLEAWIEEDARAGREAR